MESALLSLLAFLMGGGGSDLLDYVSPNAYWKDKQVMVSVETMTGELKPAVKTDVSPLIDDLNSPDPQVREQSSDKIKQAGLSALPSLREALQSPSPQIALTARRLIATIEAANRPATIRRLMAIRELGDLKDKAALPLLEPLLKSDDFFVADYAAAAIDKISGKPFARRHAANLRDDVWLLPESCRAVGQILGPPGGPVAVEQMMKDLPVPPNQDRAIMTQSVTHTLVTAAESVGNFRLESISFGIAGNVGEQSGFIVMIGHGHYDSHAIADLLHKQQIPSNLVAGVEMFQPPGAEMLLFFPSDEYAVLLASPKGVDTPVEPILDAIKTGRGKLKAVPEMKKLIEAAPAEQPLWAVAKITPAFAQAPAFAPFDTMELQTHKTNQGLAATITGTGTQPDKAKAAVNMINAGAKQAANSIKDAEQFFPGAKVLAKAFEEMKCDAKDGNATLTTEIDASQSALLIVPMMMMGRQEVRHEAPAATQPVNVK